MKTKPPLFKIVNELLWKRAKSEDMKSHLSVFGTHGITLIGLLCRTLDAQSYTQRVAPCCAAFNLPSPTKEDPAFIRLYVVAFLLDSSAGIRPDRRPASRRSNVTV